MRPILLAAALLAVVLPVRSFAGFHLTDSGCNLLAGSPDSCQIVGPATGSINFEGALGTGTVWSLSHQVKEYAVTSAGCTPEYQDGTYETKTTKVVDESGSGPGPVNETRSVLPGVLYTVDLIGSGELVAGAVDSGSATDVAGSAPTGGGPEDKTLDSQPTAVCATPIPNPPPGPTGDPTKPAPTPVISCDKGSNPETGVDGDISNTDISDGRWMKDYYCNARLVSQIGEGGGYRVERYADHSGHVCAYFDTGTLFPNSLHSDGSGVWAVDMTDPAKPIHTASLSTPAMLTPHESLRLNQKRGLLVAEQGNPASEPGLLDVYDVTQDCRQPKLDAEIPDGYGHESGFAPDGKTFYVSNNGGFLAAVDLTDPTQPAIIWTSGTWTPHGLSLSDDGKTMFIADTSNAKGMTILDVSQIQERTPNPQVTQLAHLTWPEVSIPQNATPFTQFGHQYVVETDEFGGGSGPVGGGHIINVDDPRNPYLVSRLRLAVFNQNDANKTGHYCTVPSRIDPYIIACGYLSSGLRVFDIRDISQPKEVAYANFTSYQETVPYKASNGIVDTQQVGHVYSAPAYDPVHNDIWYSDGTRGFFAIHLTRGSGIKRFAGTYVQPGS